MAFRLFLSALGLVFTAASRWSEAFRRQLTRDLVIELRSDDGVARHFVFRDRRATSQSGRATSPDCAIRFATAAQGFRALSAHDGPHRLLAGMIEGTIAIEGRTTLMPWFQGLVPAAIPLMPVLRLPATPPQPYVRPGASPEVAKRITIEPAAVALDPTWTDAAAARERLLMMRIAAGESVKPF